MQKIRIWQRGKSVMIDSNLNQTDCCVFLCSVLAEYLHVGNLYVYHFGIKYLIYFHYFSNL